MSSAKIELTLIAVLIGVLEEHPWDFGGATQIFNYVQLPIEAQL